MSDKPIIELDYETGCFSFVGSSFPENAMEFYRPIIKDIENYFTNGYRSCTINFNFHYINTGTENMVYKLVKLLKELDKERGMVKVNWIYNASDEDMKMIGENIMKYIDFPIALIEKD